MKAIVSAILIAVCCLTVTACGRNVEDGKITTDGKPIVTTTGAAVTTAHRTTVPAPTGTVMRPVTNVPVTTVPAPVTTLLPDLIPPMTSTASRGIVR